MPSVATIKAKYPVGDFAVWIIIYIELITFAMLFLGYAFSRRADVELFNQSQLVINQTSGFINTMILITSSFFVAKAVQSVKNMTLENYQESNKKLQNGFCLLLCVVLHFCL